MKKSAQRDANTARCL